MREEKFHIYLNDDEYSRVKLSVVPLPKKTNYSISSLQSVYK